MPKHLSDAQTSALAATATSLLFQTLDMVKVHPDRPTDEERGCAASMVMAAAFVAAEDLWSRKIAVEALAATAAATMGVGPEVGAFVRFWQEALGERLEIATPEERLARKARQDFADQVARLETADEYDQRTGGQGMSGDDAIDTLSSLITMARGLSKESASWAFRFESEVSGHAAPEGGEL